MLWSIIKVLFFDPLGYTKFKNGEARLGFMYIMTAGFLWFGPFLDQFLDVMESSTGERNKMLDLTIRKLKSILFMFMYSAFFKDTVDLCLLFFAVTGELKPMVYGLHEFINLFMFCGITYLFCMSNDVSHISASFNDRRGEIVFLYILFQDYKNSSGLSPILHNLFSPIAMVRKVFGFSWYLIELGLNFIAIIKLLNYPVFTCLYFGMDFSHVPGEHISADFIPYFIMIFISKQYLAFV